MDHIQHLLQMCDTATVLGQPLPRKSPKKSFTKKKRKAERQRRKRGRKQKK